MIWQKGKGSSGVLRVDATTLSQKEWVSWIAKLTLEQKLEGLDAYIEYIWQQSSQCWGTSQWQKPTAGACLRNSMEANLTGWVSQREQNKRRGQRGDDAGIQLLISSSLSWLISSERKLIPTLVCRKVSPWMIKIGGGYDLGITSKGRQKSHENLDLPSKRVYMAIHCHSMILLG